MNKKLCLISIFKNESVIMEEWIQHYLKMGVDKFLLIDNGSTDDYVSILSKYIEKGLVTVKIDTEKWIQNELYNRHYLEDCKLYEWTMIVDFDEFVYSRKNFKTITNYLDSLDKSIINVKIPWKMFGSNGHITQPKSVIHGFTKRINRKCKGLIDSKSIYRSSYIKRISAHICDTNQKYIGITSDNKKVLNNSKIFIDEDIIENSCLNLNHYNLQSKEWFLNVKGTRGDIFSSKLDNIRNIDYFCSYNNCVNNNPQEDKELSLLTSNCL